MAKKIITYNGGEYDSLPEAVFKAWLNEATALGIIKDVREQVTYGMTPAKHYYETVHLKTKDKVVKRTLLKPSTYTSDFEFYALRDIHGVHDQMGYCKPKFATVVVDVKGESNNANAKGLFSLKQKMMMATNDVYVNKVIPGQFFMANGWPTELPRECYMQKGGLYAWLRKYQAKDNRSIKEVYDV